MSNTIRQLSPSANLFPLIHFRSCSARKEFPSFVRAVNARNWQWAADELKYVDGKKKGMLSDCWTQLHGDPVGTDDGRLERPEEIYMMIREG